MIYFKARVLTEDPADRGVYRMFAAPDAANLAATMAAVVRHVSPGQPLQHVQMAFLDRFPPDLPVTILTTEETSA